MRLLPLDNFVTKFMYRKKFRERIACITPQACLLPLKALLENSSFKMTVTSVSSKE